MDPNLERARDELETAADGADGAVETQLRSISEGIFEEEGGEKTQTRPGPKPDRVAELMEKLTGLADETGPETATMIEAAQDDLRTYMKAHPQGG